MVCHLGPLMNETSLQAAVVGFLLALDIGFHHLYWELFYSF